MQKKETRKIYTNLVERKKLLQYHLSSSNCSPSYVFRLYLSWNKSESKCLLYCKTQKNTKAVRVSLCFYLYHKSCSKGSAVGGMSLSPTFLIYLHISLFNLIQLNIFLMGSLPSFLYPLRETSISEKLIFKMIL